MHIVRSAFTVAAVLSFTALAAGGDASGRRPPDGWRPSPLFLDLSVDPAVDITIYPTFKDEERSDPDPKPRDLTDEVVAPLKEKPPALGGAKDGNGGYDVGIIPERANGCPPGSSYVLIHTDDEDKDNNSYTSGWTGAVSRDPSGTTFGFCRVDGSDFTRVPLVSYAVLKLGSDCPPGSYDATHHLDNENKHTHNYTQGDYAPSMSFDGYVNPLMGDTTLWFCAFPAESTFPLLDVSSYFPDFGISYGVFGDPSSFWLDSGHVHTDDEDSSFGNDHDPSSTWSPDVDISGYVYETQGQARPNSEFDIGKVWDVPCTTPCPLSGSWYDGANCYVATPPAGTTPFIYAGNLYYSALSAPTCPVTGSWYDGANCFVATPPAGTTPFIYAGNLYHSPLSGNVCPLPGSWFDGANCFVASPPTGTTAFVYGGNLYYSAQSVPTCPLPGSWYDGANCFVATPPAETTPFVWSGHLYYSPVCRP